ncbi:MAG: SCP2 sterol-binding domain-containing protein [Oscillospiraceae bacterium]
MTYHELVAKVQAALAKADASKVENHIAVQVNVTGEAEGAFYIEISDGVPVAQPFDYNDRDALLTADGAEILNVVQGKVSLEDAIKEGKIAHEGDWDKTVELSSVIPVKKRGRKAAATKAEEVKEKAEAKVEEVKADVKAKAEEVKADVKAKAEEVKEKAEAKVEEVKTAVEAKVEEAKADAPKKRGRKAATATKTTATKTKKTTAKKKK